MARLLFRKQRLDLLHLPCQLGCHLIGEVSLQGGDSALHSGLQIGADTTELNLLLLNRSLQRFKLCSLVRNFGTEALKPALKLGALMTHLRNGCLQDMNTLVLVRKTGGGPAASRSSSLRCTMS